MGSDTITLEVKARGKPIHKLPKDISVPSDASVGSLYSLISEQARFSIHRLRITKGSDGKHIQNSEGITIGSTGLQDRSVVYVKDLGPQLGWRTVYVVEYLGPLLIHPLVLYVLRPYIYSHAASPPPAPSYLQAVTCILLTLHYLKRELETLFVHRFSLATMPAAYIFRNSAHYWILGGANMAYWVFSPTSSTTAEPNPLLLYTGLAIYAFGELANFNTHLMLSNLRKDGSKKRVIPSGFGFGLVTCPNYLFEIFSWIGVYLVSGLNWSILLFIVVGSGTMMTWASGKEKRYRQEFGHKYKPKRYVMFPGIW